VRHHAFRQDASLVVDVLQEQVQGVNALGQTAFQPLPFTGRDDAREQVVGENPLGPLVIAVDGEGDALVEECAIGGLLPEVQLRHGNVNEAFVQEAVVVAGNAARVEHLVEGAIELVAIEGRPGSLWGGRRGQIARGPEIGRNAGCRVGRHGAVRSKPEGLVK
jgi:hypothetical protein